MPQAHESDEYVADAYTIDLGEFVLYEISLVKEPLHGNWRVDSERKKDRADEGRPFSPDA